MPVDMHSLVAMYAPRGLLVLDNSRIGELGSTAQHAASAAGARVYEALGVEKNIEYHGGNPSDPHNHCMFYASQQEPPEEGHSGPPEADGCTRRKNRAGRGRYRRSDAMDSVDGAHLE